MALAFSSNRYKFFIFLKFGVIWNISNSHIGWFILVLVTETTNKGDSGSKFAFAETYKYLFPCGVINLDLYKLDWLEKDLGFKI